jgi:hypothetical protein
MARFTIPQILLLVLLLVISTLPINAEVPSLMNYQGRLTDQAGNPVADLPHNVTFKIYDETDTVRWEESHTITTVDGLFTVQLGSNGSPLTADVFNYAECWLGITVDTEPEVTPRTRLNTVPYAFKTGSVRSHDIVNEPGVAAYSGAYYVYLADLAYTVLCSLTITCPAEGYIMAVAHGRIATLPQHTSGTNSYAVVGISDNSTSLPGNQDLDFYINSSAPSGIYSVPFGMTSMFEVTSAGSYTYYYLAYEYSGSVTVADMQFNLIYFPTAYGTVDPVPPPAKSPDGDGSIWLDGLKQIITNPEHPESGALDIAQLERELAAMKTKIEAMQQRIDDYGIKRQ